MKIGWNLGNSLDVPEGETGWGNPPVTRALIQAVAKAGFGVVRIPATWSLHMGGGPNYTIDSAWVKRVAEVVGYVRDAGMYAIINVHHDGADNYGGVEWIILGDTSAKPRFVKVWEQIAAHFRDHDQRLVFESMNEIHDGYGMPKPSDYTFINDLNQAFVDTIRNSGGNNANRLLVVPGYNTNIEYTLAGFAKPNDKVVNKLILSVHFYDPWSYAGEGATHTWGAASPGRDSWGQEEWVNDAFGRLKSKYIDDGLPVLIGEYGAVNQEGYEDYRRYYMEYVTKAAHDRTILPIYWDNGGFGSGPDKFGIFDRNSGAIVYSFVLDAMMRAVNDSYAISAIKLPVN